MKSGEQDIFFLVAQYEQEITEAVGMPISMVRFAAAFIASVLVGFVLKFVPTPKGEISMFCPAVMCTQLLRVCTQHACLLCHRTLQPNASPTYEITTHAAPLASCCHACIHRNLHGLASRLQVCHRAVQEGTSMRQ